MIDFVKVALPGSIKDLLLEHPLLDFKVLVSSKTGEVDKRWVAEFKGLKFIVYDSGFVLLQGSLHKYKNEGKYNFDNFTFSELKAVLHEVADLFFLDLTQCRLLNVEVGVNVKPVLQASKILQELVFHKQVPFKDVSVPTGCYRQAIHGRYIVKAYDKAAEARANGYPVSREIFRFEVKFKKMLDLKPLDVLALSDLLESAKLNALLKLLLKEWKAAFMYDPTIQLNKLPKNERYKMLCQWKNCSWWKELSKQKRYAARKAYFQVVEKHSQKVQRKIAEAISKQCGFLLLN